MNSTLRHRLAGAALAALAAGCLVGQTPVDPPPWWLVNDDVTVSLAWNFDSAANPLTPNVQVVPTWYQPAITHFQNSANVVRLPGLGGHTGVLGFTGAGTGTMALTVDNDPHYDWVKVFWFQYDGFSTSSGAVGAAIRQDLAKYKRAIVSEKTVSLGNNWVRTTIDAQLIPQPDDETLDFSLTESALGSVAIDNLFVNSHCVKPMPDATGDALGDVDVANRAAPTDLTALTGQTCIAAAVTETPPPNATRSLWISARSATASPHLLFRQLTPGGTTSTSVGISATQAPLGMTDLAVATLPVAAGQTQTFVYGILDQRTSVQPSPPILLVAVDAVTGALDNTHSVQIPEGQLPLAQVPQQALGLTFFPPGNNGAGTFWITDQQGNAYEFAFTPGALGFRTGRGLDSANNGMPPGVVGAGYDAVLGKFYWFSRTPNATARGVTQVTGIEHSAYDFQPTGVRFFGDLELPNPGGALGGIASGLEVYRRRATGDLRMVCVAQAQGRSWLYELKGPFAFGWNHLGRCGMSGEPVYGSNNFRVNLSGVPHATGAVLYGGFSDTQHGPTPLPFNLTAFGMPESNISVSLDMNSPFLPVLNGSTSFSIPLPPAIPGISYTPMFFQWVVFDPTVPNGVATSQAGKTMIY